MNAHSPEQPENVKPPKAKRMETNSWVDTDQEAPAEEDMPPPYPRSGNIYRKAMSSRDIPRVPELYRLSPTASSGPQVAMGRMASAM